MPCSQSPGLSRRPPLQGGRDGVPSEYSNPPYPRELGVVWILLYCFPKIGYCLLEVFLVPPAPMVSSSEVEDIGSNVLWSFLLNECSVLCEKLNLQRLRNSLRDVSLYLENVLQLSVVLLRPDW